MGREGRRRRGRLILWLLLLNLLALAAGLAWEHWQGLSAAVPNINADKILLLSAQEGHSKEQ
ncbi:hypothetical protein EDC61_104134 [Sulfuritortus calidifontis]|uniref:Uncharacterized protein n=1 Tax=Sulfuritortus calidifontis TaxID=1914471 RepID=A0A4R3JWM1_9PROT|nr:hypothetical protein EDC61_104134 [Sulfuritortus calidifontis]